MTEYVYMNGEYIESDKAVLPVRTHAFLYGTSVFEGIRAYYNKENKSDITDVIIAKNFDGMLDTIKVAWMSEYCMFGNTIVIEEEKDGE